MKDAHEAVPNGVLVVFGFAKRGLGRVWFALKKFHENFSPL